MKLVRTGVGVTGTGNTGIGVRGTSNNICVRGDGDGSGVVGGSTIGTGVAPFGPSPNQRIFQVINTWILIAYKTSTPFK